MHVQNVINVYNVVVYKLTYECAHACVCLASWLHDMALQWQLLGKRGKPDEGKEGRGYWDYSEWGVEEDGARACLSRQEDAVAL